MSAIGRVANRITPTGSKGLNGRRRKRKARTLRVRLQADGPVDAAQDSLYSLRASPSASPGGEA